MKLRFLFLACMGWSAVASAAPDPERGRLLSGIAAIANDAIITIQEVEVISAGATRGMERLPQYRARPELLDREYFRAKNDAVEHLVERQLIIDDFKTSGLVFPESIIDEQIRDIVRKDYGDRATMAKSLKAEGLTIEAFRQKQRDSLIVRAMEGRNVRDVLIISPAKIEAYYQTNLSKYKLEDQLHLRGIVLKCGALSTSDDVRRLAREIREKITQGVPFTEMATTYNSEPAQSRNQGDWGWHETSKLSKGIAEVAAGLEAGKLSGVFSKARDGENAYWIYTYDDAGRLTRGRKYSIQDGKEVFVEEKQFAQQANHDGVPVLPQEFYLIKLEEKKEAHVRSLDDLRDEIEKDLLVQERARLRNKWVDRLKTKSFVRRF